MKIAWAALAIFLVLLVSVWWWFESGQFFGEKELEAQFHVPDILIDNPASLKEKYLGVSSDKIDALVSQAGFDCETMTDHKSCSKRIYGPFFDDCWFIRFGSDQSGKINWIEGAARHFQPASADCSPGTKFDGKL